MKAVFESGGDWGDFADAPGDPATEFEPDGGETDGEEAGGESEACCAGKTGAMSQKSRNAWSNLTNCISPSTHFQDNRFSGGDA